MSLCPLYGCSARSWPCLYDLCPGHFHEHVIQPLRDLSYDTERLLFEQLTLLYGVEVATKQRPGPYVTPSSQRQQLGLGYIAPVQAEFDKMLHDDPEGVRKVIARLYAPDDDDEDIA